MINLPSGCIIILIWIIFIVCSEHIYALSLRINLSFRINTIFIGIFYIKYSYKIAFGKHISLEMRFIEKLKLVRYMYTNNFHFKVFVKNLSKYITLQYCWNVLLQYNKKWTS